MHAWQCARGLELDDSESEERSWSAGVHSALVALVEGRAGVAAAVAARKALAAAWPLLLPTPQIRAHHLIALLPQGEQSIQMLLTKPGFNKTSFITRSNINSGVQQLDELAISSLYPLFCVSFVTKPPRERKPLGDTSVSDLFFNLFTTLILSPSVTWPI